MFSVFAHSVVTANTAGDPHVEVIKLSAGVIHQVDILFQDGCDHLANVMIFHGGHQLWPSNRGKAFRGNATAVSFREFYELEAGGTELTALIWGDGSDLAEVIIQIGLLPKAIIQPLSFDELLAAATGT